MERKAGEPKLSIFERYPELRSVPRDRYPRNVFIIPDGNARWAALHRLSVQAGHDRGAQVSLSAFRDLSELSEYIPFVGAWGFSVDNLARPKREVEFLMQLFDNTLQRLAPDFIERNNRFVHIGRKDMLFPYPSLLASIAKTEELTSRNTGQVVYIALGFGGEDQEVRIAQKIAEMAKVDPQLEVTKGLIESLRDGDGKISPADLIIRSSGEHRLSDVGWIQGKGTELYFPRKFFPDFSTKDFVKAIVDFSKRERRFGGRPTQSRLSIAS